MYDAYSAQSGVALSGLSRDGTLPPFSRSAPFMDDSSILSISSFSEAAVMAEAVSALTAPPPPPPHPPPFMDLIRERIPSAKRGEGLADAVVSLLSSRSDVFGPLDPAKCTQVVSFALTGKPQEVSFKMEMTRRALASKELALAKVEDLVSRGIVERVAPSEPSYGFVFVIPKAGGGIRLTINPTGINSVTAKLDPDGGFMPSLMVFEPFKAGRLKHVAQLDLSDAFSSLKLDAAAQRLSTFTSPFGKLRWKQGWFGWHSFPALFQKLIMEHVVLPTEKEFPSVKILAWIDDLVVAAPDEAT
jgi:hypothetical protein